MKQHIISFATLEDPSEPSPGRMLERRTTVPTLGGAEKYNYFTQRAVSPLIQPRGGLKSRARVGAR